MGWREYHNSPSKNFCLTILSIFVGENSVFEKISGIQKFYGKKGDGGSIIISRKRFLSHSTEKLRWGKFRCFRRFQVSKILGIRERADITLFR